MGGRLGGGDRLPTVRGLAAALRTSPATVSLAYRILRERGLIVTSGRRGTRVSPRPPMLVSGVSGVSGASGVSTASGVSGVSGASGVSTASGVSAAGQPAPAAPAGVRDLSQGLPDPELLPSVADALHRVDAAATLRITEADRDDPALIALFKQAFAADGIPADHLVITSGGLDGLERVLAAHLRPGDRVLVDAMDMPEQTGAVSEGGLA